MEHLQENKEVTHDGGVNMVVSTFRVLIAN